MALLVVGVAMWSACGSADRTEWAAEAEAWHEDLRTSLGVEGGTVWAR